MDRDFIVVCPHCHNLVLIEQLNCGYFRHGAYKNGQQINPHASREECKSLRESGMIVGCGGPFKVSLKEKEWVAEACDYI